VRSPRRWWSRGATIGAAAVLVPLAVVSVSSAATGSVTAGRVTVTAGVNVRNIPGVQAVGAATPYTRLSLSFVLKERDIGQIERQVDGGMHNFVTVQQFAKEYGQPLSFVKALESYLVGYGISDFTLYADGVNLKAEGTVAAVDAALGIHEENYRVPAQRAQAGMQGVPEETVHAATTLPTLPGYLASGVVAVLGLSSYSPWVDNVVPPVRIGGETPQLSPNVAGTTNCAKYGVLGAVGLTAACRTPSQFAATYGLDPLAKGGALGQGQTLAIVTLAGLDATAPSTFWSTVLGMAPSGRSLSVVTVDGGPGAPSGASGSDETDLDVEQSGALAPDATIVVYQAPNGTWTAAFTDAFFTAASQNVASTVSSSWGFSEPLLEYAGGAGVVSPGYLAAFDEAFLEMAMQGQSTFIASGDAGAYAGHRTLGSTNLSVGGPADSPYVTSAGGTTLPTAAFGVTAQRAWGWDYLWPIIATQTGVTVATVATVFTVGDTGGYSQYEPMPSYQSRIPGIGDFSDVQYHTPTDFVTVDPGVSLPFGWTFTPTPSVRHGSASGRAEPDLSTDADPETGYLYYEPVSTGGSGLNDAGGTSFVAPQLNGSAAVIDSFFHHRVGLWNPVLYNAARQANSALVPLDSSGTTNDNLYYTGTRGGIWNPATGLGYPDLSKLLVYFTEP
jgi:kumamolisin